MNFKNTDIVVVNFPNIDYPLFRKFLIENHHLFNKIHYVFSYNSHTWEKEYKHKYNYSELAKTTMPFANFYWGDEFYKDNSFLNDQRNHATTLGLKNVDKNADSVLFLEADIIINNMNYFLNLPDTYDFVGYCENASFRIHPSFLWIKKNIIDKTSKNFSGSNDPVFSNFKRLILPPWSDVPIKDRIDTCPVLRGGDGFDNFVSELLGITTNGHLFHYQSFEYIHLGGISQTLFHFRSGNYEGVYDLVRIRDYFNKTLNECKDIVNDEYVQEVNTHLNVINKLLTN